MAVVTVWVVRAWSTDAQIQHMHVHPAWFIPVVGNIVVPLAGGVPWGIASAIVIALGVRTARAVRTARGFITGELLKPED